MLFFTTLLFFFFLNDPAPTEFYPLPLHDALPIYRAVHQARRLRGRQGLRAAQDPGREGRPPAPEEGRRHADRTDGRPGCLYRRDQAARRPCRPRRSEEHTSELQSPCNLVCRLLLE